MPARARILPLAVLVALLCAGSSGGGGGARLFGALAIILTLAKLGGELFERLGQPAVLGELLAGILLGNLRLLGVHDLDFVVADPGVAVVAEIGVVLLLFEVGLESDLGQMRRVGGAATLVAAVGVVTPMALGYAVHAALAPDHSWHTHLFIGAILTATSVAITARVLRDLGKIDTPTGQVILGAAVIDDVMGLVVLAVVGGIVVGANTGAELAVGDISLIVVKAVAFMGGAIALGPPASRLLFKVATALRVRGVLLAAALAFCFAVSWGAAGIGLAPIVGAFAAGLVLDSVVYQDLEKRETHGLEVQVRPLTGFLVPVFFVMTGARVDLGVLADPSILLLALLLTVAAVLGKQACALAAYGPGVDRIAVGLGMIPRGEVGLIFAVKGAELILHGEPVVGPQTYAAVVVVVMVTTMVTPPVLAWALERKSR